MLKLVLIYYHNHISGISITTYDKQEWGPELWPRSDAFFDYRDAGLALPGSFEPDLSFFSSESFRQLSLEQRTVLYVYDMSTLHKTQYCVGFGGWHSLPSLFQATKDAFGHFLDLLQGQNEDAVCLVEGGIRRPDVAWSDEKIFATYSEIGLVEALAMRAGIEVRCAEPNDFAIDALAEKHGIYSICKFLEDRIIPQWHLLDPATRPPAKEYVFDVLTKRSYLKRLLAIAPQYEFEPYLSKRRLQLPYEPHIPERQYCLEQTTHEFIVSIPESERSTVQKIALEFNLQRDRRLHTEINRLLGQGLNVFYVYGDVHIRALDKDLRQRSEAMRKVRESIGRQLFISSKVGPFMRIVERANA